MVDYLEVPTRLLSARVAAGYEVDAGDQQPQFSARLEIGRCAFFYVYVRDRLRRLTTSEIQDVSLARNPTLGSTEC